MMVRQNTGTAVTVLNWKGHKQVLNPNVWENLPEFDTPEPFGDKPKLDEEKENNQRAEAEAFLKRFKDSPAYETMSDKDFKLMKAGKKTEAEILGKLPKPEPEEEEEPPVAEPVKKSLKDKVKDAVKSKSKGKGKKGRKK